MYLLKYSYKPEVSFIPIKYYREPTDTTLTYKPPAPHHHAPAARKGLAYA